MIILVTSSLCCWLSVIEWPRLTTLSQPPSLANLSAAGQPGSSRQAPKIWSLVNHRGPRAHFLDPPQRWVELIILFASSRIMKMVGLESTLTTASDIPMRCHVASNFSFCCSPMGEIHHYPCCAILIGSSQDPCELWCTAYKGDCNSQFLGVVPCMLGGQSGLWSST